MKFFLKMVLPIICLLILTSCKYEHSPAEFTDNSTSTVDVTNGQTNSNDKQMATVTTAGTTVPPSSFFEIHFLDVGQADAALVLCDDEAMLIDGGNAEDSSLIYSYLKNHGINHLEYIICTHPHEDHVGGLSGALNYATVGTVYCSMDSYDSKTFDSFKRYLEKQNKEIEIPSVGDTFSLGGSTVSILGPVGNYTDINNMSIVLRIQYGNTSFLFTGDSEIDSEQDILNTGKKSQKHPAQSWPPWKRHLHLLPLTPRNSPGIRRNIRRQKQFLRPPHRANSKPPPRCRSHPLPHRPPRPHHLHQQRRNPHLHHRTQHPRQHLQHCTIHSKPNHPNSRSARSNHILYRSFLHP